MQLIGQAVTDEIAHNHLARVPESMERLNAVLSHGPLAERSGVRCICI